MCCFYLCQADNNIAWVICGLPCSTPVCTNKLPTLLYDIGLTVNIWPTALVCSTKWSPSGMCTYNSYTVSVLHRIRNNHTFLLRHGWTILYRIFYIVGNIQLKGKYKQHVFEFCHIDISIILRLVCRVTDRMALYTPLFKVEAEV